MKTAKNFLSREVPGI